MHSQHNGSRLLPNLGINHLTIKEAAELIAVDMWAAGGVEGVDEPDGYEGDLRDPRLLEALKETISVLERRLAESIDLGRLGVVVLARNLDERIAPGETYICFDELAKWLKERKFWPGDALEEWQRNEDTLLDRTCEQIGFQRAVIWGGGANRPWSIAQKLAAAEADMLDESDLPALHSALRGAIAENHELQEKIRRQMPAPEAAPDRIPPAKARNTLLILIAALCKRVGIDPRARGAAQRIMEFTEALGTPVTDDTILKILDDIPKAVESRRT